MGYQGFFAILMINLISSKNLGVYRNMRHTVGILVKHFLFRKSNLNVWSGLRIMRSGPKGFSKCRSIFSFTKQFWMHIYKPFRLTNWSRRLSTVILFIRKYKVLYLNIRLKMAITALNCSDELFRTFESCGYQMARTTMSKRMLTTSMPKHKITEKKVRWGFLFNTKYHW